MKPGQWWDVSLSLVDGCTRVSEACEHCWLMGMGKRFHNLPEQVTFREDRLQIARRGGKPKRFAVWSDLFHEAVTPRQIDLAVEVMGASQHTFYVLTKRAQRLVDWYHSTNILGGGDWFPNIWWGVTVELPEYLWRIEKLLQIPGKHFVSIEPLLGPMDLLPCLPCRCYEAAMAVDNCELCMLKEYRSNRLDWVIVGGETGPGARPMHPDSVRSIRDQCQAAGVPFWFKGWGEFIPAFEAGFRSEEKDQYGKSFGEAWVRSKKLWRFEDGIQMVHVGTKRAGRILDGRTWEERP